MAYTETTREIAAPIEKVFQTISDVRNFSKAVPHITNIEFLSEKQTGVGTRFRETRIMGGKEATTELEVKEYVENKSVRMVSELHGTVWDTLFSVQEQGANTVLRLHMDANASRFFSKIMNRLIRGMVRKAIEKDMDAVKAYCEK